MTRLQRNDLAKEFSEIVQQEIKNHNDSILATNISINAMRQAIEDLRLSSDQKCASFESTCDIQLGAFGILRDKFEQSVAKLKSEINDLSKQSKIDLRSVTKSFEERLTYFMTVDGFQDFNKKIDQWTANIQRSFQSQQEMMRQQTDRIFTETMKSIDVIKKAVQESMAQEIEDRKKQDVTLDHFAVNFSGMQREIEILKKRCHVLDKNIENLYTQIERLKVAK